MAKDKILPFQIINLIEFLKYLQTKIGDTSKSIFKEFQINHS